MRVNDIWNKWYMNCGNENINKLVIVDTTAAPVLYIVGQ